MGIKDWFKPKETETLSMPDYATASIKEEVMPPIPKPKITMEQLGMGIQELNNNIAAIAENQQILYDLVVNSLNPKEVIVLNSEELKYIPEEQKDFYMELKKTNKEMAEQMLKTYKGKK